MKLQRTIGFLKYQRESESDVPLKTELEKQFRNTIFRVKENNRYSSEN